MRNLHKYYYKEYFSLQDVPINNVNRHLDYELLIDDTKKNEFGNQIRRLENEARNARGQQKLRLEAQIEEIKAQLSTNVNVLKVRNNVLTGNEFTNKDQQGKPTRKMLEDAYISNEVAPKDANNRFSLEIQYPGLVTGIGIDHETKIEGEFKLGVHFDWTHGMPVVYGSSVKGVLRSWFTEFYKGDLDPIDLMMDIFEGVYDRDVKAEQEKYKEDWAKKTNKVENRIYKSRRNIYKRDIFFDAVIVEADKIGRILCSDSITPHDKNPLKNPTPITFLKIAPGCKLEFRFKLHDSDFGDGKILTALQKKTLFEEILKTVGIGAKTNVGYGQLK